MSNALRSAQNSKVMYLIMGLLMLGLTGFGLGGFTGGTVKSIGSVGEEEIPAGTYARAYQGAISQLSSRAGRNLSPAEIEQFGIGASVLEAVIGMAAVDNEARQIGLSVGDEIIRAQILANPNFQGIDGKFDQAAYEYYLDRQLNVTPKEFDDLLRKENARSLIQAAVSSGYGNSTTIAATLIGYTQESRDFEWAWITELNLKAPLGKPTQSELMEFYEDNPERYRSLRSYNVSYAWLSPDMLLDSVPVSDEELRESYKLQDDRFNRPEQRSVERLVFPTRADAQDARDRLDAQLVTFEQLVAERGLALEDVDLGDIRKSDVSPDAAKAIFADSNLGIVGPVESSLGPALFRINAVMAEDNTPFEDVRDELRAELAGEAARREISAMVTEIDDLLAGGAEIEDLGRETAMQTGTIDFDANSTGGLTGYAPFREAVLNTKPGDFPELVDLDDGGVFALRVNKINEPALIPFEEVKTRVANDWKQDRTLKALKEIADEMQPKLAAGESLTALGLAPNSETDARRDSFFQGMPPQTMQEVFKLAPGEVTAIDGPNGVLLVRLSAINAFDPDAEENKAGVAQLAAALNGQIGADAFDLYAAALRQRAGVNLNQAAINSINSQIATR